MVTSANSVVNKANRLYCIPKELGVLQDAPKELYYLGNTQLLSKPKVSIVGSRRCSSYARHTTYQIAKELSNVGVSVVSGGAMGIDASAHNGAFPNTIAIFANSLDKIYPQANAPLIKKIYKDALALSEKKEGYSPHPFDFVLRNRLVVALGELLIISEADEDSGSMRSAEIALELGKEIFVLPHRLSESRGTQRLLRDGAANVILDVMEFVKRFGNVDKSEDEIIIFCKTNPTIDDAIARYGNQIYEYELDGKIAIQNGKVVVL